MKDIFDLMQPQNANNQQQSSTHKTQKQTKQEQTYMQRLISEPKEVLSAYDIISNNEFIFFVRRGLAESVKEFMHSGNPKEFFRYLRVAKHRKINLTRVKIRVDYQLEKYTMNLLEYALWQFSNNPQDAATLVRYLLASDKRFLTKKELDKAMYAWLQFSPQRARYLLREGGEEFIKLYKLFIDLGASGEKYVHHLFLGVSNDEYMVSNPNIIEMFLYENNPVVNEKIFHAFYTCANPEVLYPILEKYGFVPDLEMAIISTRYDNGVGVLNYLVDTGKINRSDLTSKKVDSAIFNHDIDWHSDITRIETRVHEVHVGAPKTKQPPKKISEKTPIKGKTKAETETKQQIDKLFDDAVKSIEQQ